MSGVGPGGSVQLYEDKSIHAEEERRLRLYLRSKSKSDPRALCEPTSHYQGWSSPLSLSHLISSGPCLSLAVRPVCWPGILIPCLGLAEKGRTVPGIAAGDTITISFLFSDLLTLRLIFLQTEWVGMASHMQTWKRGYGKLRYCFSSHASKLYWGMRKLGASLQHCGVLSYISVTSLRKYILWGAQGRRWRPGSSGCLYSRAKLWLHKA